MAAIPPARSTKDTLLGDPALRRALCDAARRRVRPSEVDDVVQATLTEALASSSAPEDPETLRRWVFGVLRHKVADLHRRGRREDGELPDLPADSAPHDARDLLSWAERALPGGAHDQQTLEWMLREGEGEKLESIATSERQPAPRVRQRVTRLRQHLRARWAAELAAAAIALGALIALVWLGLRPREPEIVRDAAPDAGADPVVELRREALRRCERGEWEACLRGLDEARDRDPSGDASDEVRRARARAAAATSATASPSAPPPAPPTTAPAPPSSAPAPTSAPPPPAPRPTEAPTAAPLPRAPTKAAPRGKATSGPGADGSSGSLK
ncbi:MAG: sigma-70 family RNA polymerase sigma factor [Polyangiaceae bacterium]|nr:sigma-70 family RNA polymerase sigma factor [Polyangiaceae bacterium]